MCLLGSTHVGGEPLQTAPLKHWILALPTSIYPRLQTNAVVYGNDGTVGGDVATPLAIVTTGPKPSYSLQ